MGPWRSPSRRGVFSMTCDYDMRVTVKTVWALVGGEILRGANTRMMTYWAGTLALSFVAGCATDIAGHAADGRKISRIKIHPVSKHLAQDPERVAQCKGFILSKNQVRDFFVHALKIEEGGGSKYYSALPCSVTGIATIDDRKYEWTIRAGGVGEFYSGRDRFAMICGQGCCKKVPSVC